MKKAKLYFGHDDLVKFFSLFNQGVEYTCKTYGEDCLASTLELSSWFVDEQQRLLTDYIGYDPQNDQVQMSFLHLAGQCAFYGYGSAAWTGDSHLPGMRLGIETHTVLQAREACYHRYQVHHLSYPPVPTAECEEEITPVWQQALSDLNLQYWEGDE